MDEFVEYPERRSAGVMARIYLLLLPIPVVCFSAALATDVAYAASAYLMWLHFSEWLLAVGLAFGALAALVLLMEFAASRAIRSGRIGWTHLLLFFGALIVELFNSFVHTVDGWTAVMPAGMALSAVGAALSLAAVAALFFMPVRVSWALPREQRA